MRFLRATIDDFGLIRHAVVDFADGLTVFTGETGSGKTMLIGALRFALGDRTEADLIRAGASRARVSVEIEPNDALREKLAGMGVELAIDDDIIITRELPASGRSHARINGVAASASQLRALATSIVDIVGQHDAQRLLAPAFALEVIDRFGGVALEELRSDVWRLHRDRAQIVDRLTSLRADDGRALAQLEFARFAAAEIDAAALEEREDVRLRERRDVLANAERIVTALGSAGAALEDEGGALDTLGIAAASLASIARFGEALGTLAAATTALQSELNELAMRLARERDAVEADPAQLEAVVARLETLERLKKKYGGSLAAVAETRAGFAAVLDGEASRDDRIVELEHELVAAGAALARQAAALSAARRRAAHELERLVAHELAALAMPSARFTVGFEPLEEIGASGAERAELRFAANPGEPARSIAKSASGGELSRVLLALIVVGADRRERTALIFDEIDAGIGGATAIAVGTRIGRLARSAQVIVITHLAQIASWADAHYALRKRESAGATVIDVQTLGARQAQLEEIARMLSGDTNPVSLKHAETLVAGARSA
jgi:DNA repair protein RecN (Recombination protein N)